MRLVDADMIMEKARHEAEGIESPFKDDWLVYMEWIIDKTPSIDIINIINDINSDEGYRNNWYQEIMSRLKF